MVKVLGSGFLLCSLLITAILMAGCSSDSSDTVVVTTVPTTVVTATYSAGDIVARTDTGTESQLFVIMNYDAVTDKYTRAWIYKNTDGSWGHFIDSKTEKADRMLIEKAYPVKVAHVTISSIPVVTPTVAVATTITYVGSGPSVKSISPSSGVKDGSVTVTIAGENFQNGAVATLIAPGEATIAGTATTVSSTSITTTFNLNGKSEGKYNVRIANPDGRSDTLQSAFTIGAPGPVISSISPSKAELNETVDSFTITGENFEVENGVTVSFIMGSVTIDCNSATPMDANRITCGPVQFKKSLNSAQTGAWDIKVQNLGGQSGTASQKFTLTNSTTISD